MNYGILVPLVVALVAPLFAYLAAARRLSGRIQHSEATSLWEEASKLRSEYKDELGRLRREIEGCYDRIGEIETVNGRLREENGTLRRLVLEHEQTINDLTAALDVLRTENHMLKARVVELENNGKA